MGRIYFASDFHLGTPDYETSLDRERLIVSWLDSIKEDADVLYLVGDVFDFWFEYRSAIPKYFTRLLGKLCELTDQGVKVIFFKGNHDMWTFDYLEKEIGIKVIHEELEVTHGQKLFYIHHGDGIGQGDYLYKVIRKVFRSAWATWLFHRLHPNFGIGLAQFLSKRSRAKNQRKDQEQLPLEKEFQFQHASKLEQQKHRDFYIFGHRHIPMDHHMDSGARLVNLGDWIHHCSYAVFDGNALQIKTYRP